MDDKLRLAYVRHPFKNCPRCLKKKPSEEFYKNATTLTGLSSACKLCVKERNRISEDKRRKGLK